MNMGKILLEGMEFFAYHGHYEEEQVIGTKFIVDLELVFDTTLAENSDRLNDTLNYQEIYRVVKREMEQPSHLLERVAKRILDAVLESFPDITNLEVKIAKVNPPLGGKVRQVSCVLAN